MSLDTMDPQSIGLSNMKYCQVFGNGQIFAEANCDSALKQFITDYSALDSITTDGSGEQTSQGSFWQARLCRNNIIGIIRTPHC